MGRFLVTMLIVWTLAAVSAPERAAAAPAATRAIEALDAGPQAIRVRADQIYTWETNKQRVWVLSGRVILRKIPNPAEAAQAEGVVFMADRAVMWCDLAEQEGGPDRGEIFAEGNINRNGDVSKPQSQEPLLLRFSTNKGIQLDGKAKLEKRSLAESSFYQRAFESKQAAFAASEPPRIGSSMSNSGNVVTSSNTIRNSERPPREVKAPDSPYNARMIPDRLPSDIRAPESPYNATRAASVSPPLDRQAAADSSNGPIVAVQGVRPPPGPPKVDPTPGSPGGPVAIEPPTFESPILPLPNVSSRKLRIGNRSSNPTNAKYLNMPNGDTIALVTGGIKLLAEFQEHGNLILDVEADQLVVWQKGGKTQDLVEAMRDRDGVTQGNDREIELYLSGNVVIRYGQGEKQVDEKVLRADRVYYDLTRNKAIALQADLEMIRPGLPVPAYFRSEELRQLSPNEFTASRSEASASKLPGDPAFDMRFRDITIFEEREQVRRTIFGYPIIDRETGEQEVGSIRRFRATNTFLDVVDIPIAWFPVLAGDVNDPIGPLQSLLYRQDQIMGAQILSTWSILELIGVKKLPGERWDLMLDYMSKRGPAIGTVYEVAGKNLFGFAAPFQTRFLAYGINDSGFERLGGPRDANWEPPGWRGRINWRHMQEYDNFSFQGQVAYLSDQNFLEQYYKYEFDMGPNQETFAYLKYQQGLGAISVLAEPNLDRPWVTETQWLPKVEGQWLGQSFFDLLTYNTWASAAYADLQVYNLPLSQIPATTDPALIPTETPLSTGRFDWMHQLSLPFSAGALRLVPYVNVDVAYYTQDNNGDGRGRLYGGAGTRASFPLSKLYDGVHSELFNLHGLYHKMTFVGNYYTAYSDTPASLLPQLDRLNDDATQQSVRDITPWQPVYVPGPEGLALLNSPLYNPRLYAIRRLVDTKADTLDTIQVVQAEVRQRWQTKRGYPGLEHTVDYITLDLSASYFPAANRDNFGHPVSFLEYNASWAVGDRNGFTSSGWFDPFDFGTRYWNVNAYFNRPDNTNFTIGYREYEPVGSRVLSGSVSYIFSPKYAVTFTSAYDLSIANNQSNSLMISRVGTDLTWSVGFSHNMLVNNFGINFMVLPNLVASRNGLTNPIGNSMYGRQ